MLDLFAGCGGLSLGFQRAGCEIVGGVELDRKAAEAHALNFHKHISDPKLYEEHARHRDITKTNPEDLLRSWGYEEPKAVVDFLIGGPPCPAFTRVGRAKLREIHQHPEAYKQDPRAQLYEPYLRFVEYLQPVALLMENVPDVMNFGGHNLGEEIAEVLESLGYQCRYTLLNSASYGVPQMRERFILVAIHEELGVEVSFPVPGRKVEFPSGYKGSRNVALKHVDLNDTSSHFLPTPCPAADALGPVTARQALVDLPAIKSHLTGEMKKGATPLDGRRDINYDTATDRSAYVRDHMHGWPGFEVNPSKDLLNAHVTRALTWRDFRLFRDMEHNHQYPQVYQLALEKLESFLNELRVSTPLTEETSESKALMNELADYRGWLKKSSETLKLEELIKEMLERWRGLTEQVGVVAGARERVRTALSQIKLKEEHAPPASLPETLLSTYDRVERLLTAMLSSPKEGCELLLQVGRQSLKRVSASLSVRKAWQVGMRTMPGDWSVPSSSLLSTSDHDDARKMLKWLEEADSNCVSHMMFWGPEYEVGFAIEIMCWIVADFAEQLLDLPAIKRGFVPPYDPGKFPNKWRKVHPDEPARTLMAHLGKDTYSHIHFDGEQARVISVREAARLQSFPDSFRFAGTMNPGYRQIGNAVPPLFAFALAEHLKSLVYSAVGCTTELREAV